MLYRCLLLTVLLLMQSVYAGHVLEHVLHADSETQDCQFCLAAAPLAAAAVSAGTAPVTASAAVAPALLPALACPGCLLCGFYARAPPSVS